MLQSATSTFTRTLTVAQGVFAPGHLGELTKYLPFELVDDVLAETGAVQRRLRVLPSRVGVYFLLALGLFPHLGYAKVWDKLVTGLAGLPVAVPSEKALRDLRRRLGPVPLKTLFDVVAGPLAQPRTPGARYRRWRTVAFDGCSSIKVPDAERNRGWFGRARVRLGWAGYPTLRLMALVETGSRGLLGAAFGPTSHGEAHYARQLMHLLGPQSLVLADRGFDNGKLLAEFAGTGAQFLVRLTSKRRLPTTHRLPDGSYLSRIRSVQVRIIEADVTATCTDGTRLHDGYRLVTTLLDPDQDPVDTLVRLYHERWEIESAYYALRHTLMQGRVLRSADPRGVEQELWAQLTLYQLLRTAMVDAVESLPGTDLDRASFTIALEAARDQVVAAHGVLDEDAGLVGRIGQAVLAHLLPARRPRISSRKVKSPIPRYARTDDRLPLNSTKIASITISVHAAQPSTPAFVSRRHPFSPTASHPRAPQSLPLIDRTIVFLNSHPGRYWNATDLAHALAVNNINSFRVLLSRWAGQGHIAKTGRGTYTLNEDLAVLPPPPMPPHVDPALSRFEGTLAVLQSAPEHSWTAREIAPALGITNPNVFVTQLSRWARTGRITKTRRGAYTLLPDAPKPLAESGLTCEGKP
ncbi:IS4 family transposase [Streptomyces sp. NBC_00445]|uniref:IS4 family transposase n=1 Tax=Streptomyces sp. NBC_00445 TaxID=2975745 RepID=UPI002E24A470